MKSSSCQPELLVDYADGELTPAQAGALEAHLATCNQCRVTLAGLNKSLELARQVWHQNEISLAEFQPQLSPAFSCLHRVRAGAVAAAVLLALTASLVWRMGPQPVHPQEAQSMQAMAEFRVQIEREGAAARLVAVANLLARQPGGEEYARQRYEEVLSDYPETAAARELSERKDRS